jgi:hypothetical protein
MARRRSISAKQSRNSTLAYTTWNSTKPSGVLTLAVPRERLSLILKVTCASPARRLSSLTFCIFCRAVNWPIPVVEQDAAPVLISMPINLSSEYLATNAAISTPIMAALPGLFWLVLDIA